MAKLLGLDDVPGMRQEFFDAARESVQSLFPISNEAVTLDLQDVGYVERPVSRKAEREALTGDLTLARPLKGTMVLSDNATGQELDRRKLTLASVPYFTDRGTFVFRGTDYGASNQLRLKPGVYTRFTQSGGVEAPFHVKKGGGLKLSLDPQSGLFYLDIHQSKLKLYPLLQALGVEDEQIKQLWGDRLYELNKAKADPRALSRIVNKLLGTTGGTENMQQHLQQYLAAKEIDPDIAERTTGMRESHVTAPLLLATSGKLLNISGGTAEPSSRDALYAQQLFTPPAQLRFLLTHSKQDLNRALWRITRDRSLDKLPVGLFNSGVRALFFTQGLAQALEEANPLEALDLRFRVTRTGAHGLGERGIPLEARFVSLSHAGYIDPIRSVESERVGVDLRATLGSSVDSAGNLCHELINARTGKLESVQSSRLKDLTIGLPDQISELEPFAIVQGARQEHVPRNLVDYYIPTPNAMFTPMVNLVPMLSGAGHLRTMLGAKYGSQALPVVGREAPLVQAAHPDKRAGTFERQMASYAGALRSPISGRVTAVKDDSIAIQDDLSGERRVFELYRNLPISRLTFLNQEPAVRKGDVVGRGDLLARSNFTSEDGLLALGVNLRIGFLPSSKTFEDAMVISESAANRLTSEHLYTKSLDDAEDLTVGRSSFISIFPGMYSKEQIDKIDEAGLIRPGSEVTEGDPLVLGYARPSKRPFYYQLRKAGPPSQDASVVWDEPYPGVVTDAVQTRDGRKIFVKARAPMLQGDKIGGRMGSKGVVTVAPDEEMPQDAEGRPLELLISPLSVISRQNPSMVVEALLGKAARKRGEPYAMPAFSDQDLMDYARKQLVLNGLSATEDLYDPVREKTIPQVMTGELYVYKLSHTAKSKARGRSLAGYTAEETPQRGGISGSKRLGIQGINALLSHGNLSFIEDALRLRGARNPDFWNALRLGYRFQMPPVPYVHRKFFDMLQAAGINVERRGDQLHLMPLRDSETLRASSGEISSSAMLDRKTFRPIPGGLFDPAVFGGPGGKKWGHLALPFPLPQGVMEKPIATLLHIPQKDIRRVIAGERELDGKTGSAALSEALARIDVDGTIQRLQSSLMDLPISRRDKATKELKYLRALSEYKIKPEELMITAVPIAPPAARPVTEISKLRAPVVSDLNYLYKDIIDLSRAYRAAEKELPEKELAPYRAKLYDSVKAAMGLGDPVTRPSREKHLRGALGLVFSDSPKHSIAMGSILSRPVDLSGLAVITPNNRLDMNHVGLPLDLAWEVYRPFVIRRLVLDGQLLTVAVENVRDKTPRARKALDLVVSERPVVVNRAPTLHKFGMMAFWPVLTQGRTLETSPSVIHGFGGDYNGDSISFLGKDLGQFIPVKQNDQIKLLTFEQLVQQYADPNYREAQVLEQYGRGTMCLYPTEPFQLLGIENDGKCGWVDTELITIHTSHAQECYEVHTTGGLRAAFTAHHNFLGLDERCALTPVLTTDIYPGMLLPRARGFQLPVSKQDLRYDMYYADRIKHSRYHTAKARPIMLNYHTGFIFGYFVADGCITGSHLDTISLASVQEDLLTILEDWCKQEFNASIWREGNGHSVRFSSAPLARMMQKDFGRLARNKTIPDWVFSAPMEFKQGLLAGYFVGEGSASGGFSVECTSPGLLRRIQFLLAALGQTSQLWEGKPATEKRQTTHILHINGDQFDIQIFEPLRGRIEAADKFIKEAAKGAKYCRDLVPFPAAIHDYLKSLSPKDRHKCKCCSRPLVGYWICNDCLVADGRRFRTFWELEKAHLADHTQTIAGPSTFRRRFGDRAVLDLPIEEINRRYPDGRNPVPITKKHIRAKEDQRRYVKQGWCSRRAARLVHEYYNPDSPPRPYLNWLNIVYSTSIAWDKVKSVAPVERPEVTYDFQTTGLNAFAVDGGFLTHNTMLFHVPVSPAAVKDAIKMLPSANLFNPRLREVEYAPLREFAEGLYLASRRRGRGAGRAFASAEDVLRAFRRGEIAADQPVLLA